MDILALFIGVFIFIINIIQILEAIITFQNTKMQTNLRNVIKFDTAYKTFAFILLMNLLWSSKQTHMSINSFLEKIVILKVIFFKINWYDNANSILLACLVSTVIA